MATTHDGAASAPPPGRLARRLAWFAGLWFAGVLAVGTVAYVLRAIMTALKTAAGF